MSFISLPLCLTSLVLFGGLLALVVYDIRHLRLPDFLTFPLIALGLIVSWAFLDRLILSVFGTITGYLSFLGVELFYRKFKKIEGLGRGDAKLLAAGGAWAGLTGLPFVVLIASVAGLGYVGLRAIMKEETISRTAKIPFGPFLALGIAVVWVGGTLISAMSL